MAYQRALNEKYLWRHVQASLLNPAIIGEHKKRR
jgi:hypothetical protein